MGPYLLACCRRHHHVDVVNNLDVAILRVSKLERKARAHNLHVGPQRNPTSDWSRQRINHNTIVYQYQAWSQWHCIVHQHTMHIQSYSVDQSQEPPQVAGSPAGISSRPRPPGSGRKASANPGVVRLGRLLYHPRRLRHVLTQEHTRVFKIARE